jgi:hypothetical protein
VANGREGVRRRFGDKDRKTEMKKDAERPRGLKIWEEITKREARTGRGEAQRGKEEEGRWSQCSRGSGKGRGEDGQVGWCRREHRAERP